MKKFLSLCVALLMVFSLVACSNQEDINSYVESEVNKYIDQESSAESSESVETTTETNEETVAENVDSSTAESTAASTEASTEESTEEVVNDPIIGYWTIDQVKFNNVVYHMPELKDLLNEEAYQSLQLAFEFTAHEVTIYIDGEKKDTTGYKVYVPEVEDTETDASEIESSADESSVTAAPTQYIDESGQLIFTLVDETLQINQSQSTLIFIKQAETQEPSIDLDAPVEESVQLDIQ